LVYINIIHKISGVLVMTVSRSVWIPALLVVLLTACTKPEEPSVSPSSPPAAVSQEAPAPVSELPAPAPALLVYNAYSSNLLSLNGEAGEPARVFNPGDKVYVGVVLRGEAASGRVKVEWFAGDEKLLGTEETTIPVKTAAVATVELSRAAPLAPGTYKALVYLNDAPSWELLFEVLR
jgi:hypothetical protein